jgi:hypothetical protein
LQGRDGDRIGGAVTPSIVAGTAAPIQIAVSEVDKVEIVARFFRLLRLGRPHDATRSAISATRARRRRDTGATTARPFGDGFAPASRRSCLGCALMATGGTGHAILFHPLG